jgi:hypothetical protein
MGVELNTDFLLRGPIHTMTAAFQKYFPDNQSDTMIPGGRSTDWPSAQCSQRGILAE